MVVRAVDGEVVGSGLVGVGVVEGVGLVVGCVVGGGGFVVGGGGQ